MLKYHAIFRLQVVTLAAFCAACSFKQAPIVSRQTVHEASSIRRVAKPASGFYHVQTGDTLYRIAREYNCSLQDLMRWNKLSTSTHIEIGQILRVTPPPDETVTVGKAVTETPIAVKPLPKEKNEPGVSLPPSSPPPAQAADIQLLWPAEGSVSRFDDKKKGIDIFGKLGDPVRAAASGKVVYAGSGLRGYGQLIIIKHSNMYLTVYAHNQSLMIAEGKMVKAGQQIATMGNSGSEQVKSHFQLRRYGKPIDPTNYLPVHRF